MGALLLLLLSRSEKDRQSLVLPGNDDGGYMATAAVVADSTAEATADTAVHTYAAAVQGPCCAMAKNKRWKIPKSEAKTSAHSPPLLRGDGESFCQACAPGPKGRRA